MKRVDGESGPKGCAAPVEETFCDAVGNTYMLRKGRDRSKRVMYLAHKDRVGFIVMKKEGRLLTAKGYGAVGRLLGESFLSISEKGSVAVARKTSEDDLFQIDCDDEDIRLGDRFFPFRERAEQGNRIYGAGLDNAVCRDALTQMLREKEAFAFDTYVVFTDKEEIGGLGARAAIRRVDPDLAFVVDATMANNPVFPECAYTDVVIGKGMTFLLSDGATLTEREAIEPFAELARALSLPYQFAVTIGGATDLTAFDAIGSSARRLAVGVPIGNLHGDCEYCDKGDVAALRAFLTNVDNVLEKIMKNGGSES